VVWRLAPNPLEDIFPIVATERCFREQWYEDIFPHTFITQVLHQNVELKTRGFHHFVLLNSKNKEK
jgi:hypothetical protein